MRPAPISAEMTVRQAVSRWAGCAGVLEELGGARHGERWSLQELGAFARAHSLDEQTLLARLAEAAGVKIASPRKRRAEASPMSIIFVALAIALTLGAGWGVLLLLGIAFGADYGVVSGTSVHVHGVAQLWGWMALFIFAVATHLLRQNTTKPAPIWLERIATGSIILGLILFFVSLRIATGALAVAGSALLLIAALLFGISVTWSLSGSAKTQRRHGFIFLIGWLWAWAVADLYLRVKYLNAPVLPDSARMLLIALPVLGLGTNAIFGFGIRLIPGLLNITQLRKRAFAWALIQYNIGFILLLAPWQIPQIIGSLLMLVSAILYLIGMDFLRSQPSRPIYGIDPRGHVLIRVAFFWLVVGLAMIVAQTIWPTVPHAFTGAWRHALTVGFITTMILGVGHRIIPIFIRTPLASTRMMLVSAVLIILGNAGRVSLELATIGAWPWTFRAMGATGLLELTALLLFAINLLMTVRNRRHVYRADEPITPNVRVREAVNARPELQEILHNLGITMFDDVPFIAPSMTFGALALATGWQPNQLVAELAPRTN